jgi:PucR family transcriptional regulator, purine catabolism regulatory protein
MRELSTRMLEAVLEGDGLRGVAELASAEARGPVAIVLPARGLAATAPDGGELNGLAEYARARIEETEAETPPSVVSEEPVMAAGEKVGLVLLLGVSAGEEDDEPPVDRQEVLRAAALAALAEVAVTDAREEAERKLRGSLIQELRAHPLDPADATSKAAKLGCDLRRGAIALVAEISSASPSHAIAAIRPGS